MTSRPHSLCTAVPHRGSCRFPLELIPVYHRIPPAGKQRAVAACQPPVDSAGEDEKGEAFASPLRLVELLINGHAEASGRRQCGKAQGGTDVCGAKRQIFQMAGQSESRDMVRLLPCLRPMPISDGQPAVMIAHLQHQPVRDHGDELAVGGLPLGVGDGVSEIFLQRLQISPVPGHLDGMANGPLHP